MCGPCERRPDPASIRRLQAVEAAESEGRAAAPRVKAGQKSGYMLHYVTQA